MNMTISKIRSTLKTTKIDAVTALLCYIKDTEYATEKERIILINNLRQEIKSNVLVKSLFIDVFKMCLKFKCSREVFLQIVEPMETEDKVFQAIKKKCLRNW